MVILLFLVGGTMKTLPNIFQNTFYLTELYLSNMLIFLKLCSFIKKKKTIIYEIKMFKKKMYIYLILGNHIGKFVFPLPNINTLKNSLKPKKNLLYEINPEAVTVFNPKDIFKIPKEKISQNVLKPVQIQINDDRILDTIKNTKTFTAS